MEKKLEIVKRYIKYVFTEDEKQKIADRMSQAVSEKARVELKKAETMSALNAEIKGFDTEIANLAEDYSQGWTMKDFECYEIFDYDLKRVVIFRADTDERVDERAMTSSEFQQEMFTPSEEMEKMPDEKTAQIPDT